MMRNTFSFDGINSADFGVYISGDAVFDSPVASYEMIQIPGRSGDLAVYHGRSENIEVTYPAFIFDDFKANIRGLRSALMSRIGYMRLTDTYHPDEYRLGVYQGGLEVSPAVYNTTGEFDITFNCKPQRFLTSGESRTTYTQSGTITNPTLFDAKPLIRVKGQGTLGIGNQSIVVGGIYSGSIYIDTDIMDAWTLSGTQKTPYNHYISYSGDKPPVLPPGDSGISLGTGITEVSITPRWYIL